MKEKRELIEIPTKTSIIMAILMISIFITIIIISQHSKRPASVNYSTELKSVKITEIQNRGSLYISDTLVIHSSSRLLYAPYGFNKWSMNGPLIDFDTIPYVHTLGDLKVPYLLSKNKNNDTIMVKKDGDTLLFLLFKYSDQ